MPRAKKKQAQIREGKVVETPEAFVNNSDVEGIGDDSMLMPMDGNTFGVEEQEDVKQERTEDQLLFNTSPALITAVFEWLEAEILACDSVEATMILAKAHNIPIEQAIIAMDYVAKIFLAKKVSFENIHDTLKA